jgi:ferredoxin like protein
MSVNDKLIRTRFVVDSGNPHITVDTSVCSECLEGACLIVCPGQCFEKEQKKLTFSWENCIECGSCRVVCPRDAISWNYPRGGFGVCFRFG